MDKIGSKNPKSSAAGNSVDSVHSVQNSLPNSTKIFVTGKLHPDIGVPFREISLAPTKSLNGQIEVNEPVRVYDTSGPWGDPDFQGDVEQGLPLLRAKWISDRADVETVAGRPVTPADDGWLSEAHAKQVQRGNGSSKSQTPSSRELSTLNSVKERGSDGALRSQPST